MQYIEIPEFPVLRGKEAIEALYDFINELEAQRGKKLTKKQTDALIKVAKSLIASINTEKQASHSQKEWNKMPFAFVPAHSYLLPIIDVTPKLVCFTHAITI